MEWSGTLSAIQTSSGTTTLQLHDLQGDIVATASLSESETKLLSTYNSTEFGVPNEGKTPPKYAWLGATGVSTELSAGVATKGGASYIPQIARNLQTEPVVPPGTFPNGIGGGTPYTATVSAASMASAQAEATQIFEEVEAARQAAARRKAEEDCRDNPVPCLSQTPDPWYEHIYFDEEETFSIINGVEGGEAIKILFFLHKLQSVLEIGPVHWLEELAGAHTPTDWAYLVAEGVYACGEAFELQDKLFGSDKPARCEVSLPWTMLAVKVAGIGTIEEIGVPNLFQDPVFSFCLYYAQNCGSYNGKEFSYV